MCTLNEYLKQDNTCNDVIISLKSLSNQEKICILSECSLTLLQSGYTDKLTICQTHKEICAENLKRRRKRQTCGIFAINPLICCHTSSKAGDRHISVEMHTTIARNTGVFIPVGTPICRLCREQIIKAPTNYMNYSGPCFDNLETGTAAEQTHLQMNTLETKTKNKIAEAEIPPPKRKRISSQILDQVETNSQSQTSETEMTLSQVSDASVVQFSRLESLNNFLSICNVSPVKRLTNLLSESSKRTVRRYMDKTRQCFNAVAETISPNDGNFLFNSVQQQEEEQQGPCNQIMKDIYLNAGSWQFRRQVLSIIVERMSFEEAQNFIPGLTAWRYYEAKKHTANVGVGLPVKELAEKRVKINIDSLEHFIDFVTSSHVIKDLPYGQKTLKLETGEVVTIPNVIRSLSSSALINQYYQLCEEDNISPLGKSTLYRILTECAASVRTSVEGLDNYVMEGSRAFQILEEFLDTWKEEELKKQLIESKRYLKADFKVHLARQTNIQDHCMAYGLSIPGNQLQLACSHSHDQRCKSCLEIKEVLEKVISVAESKEMVNKDAIMFKVEKAVEGIKELQKHLLRSKNQELARTDIAKEMNVNDVIITCDWAMKFLPRRYREGQMDWFAKRGINWHVSVSLVKLETKMCSFSHIHIFNNQTSQDAPTTTAVICDVVKDLEAAIPNLKEISIFSDNAGCYKSTLTLLTLPHEIGSKLSTYNFSEAQNGKGPCDRKAAHAKFAIKRYINEGRDVTTAYDMKKALDKVPGQPYRVKVVDTIHDLDVTKNKDTITNITSFYNFRFENSHLRMWQAYNIGEGKLVTLKLSKNSVQLKVLNDWTEMPFTDLITEGTEQVSKQQKQTFICPMDGCIREFKNRISLDQHLLQGSCEYKLEKGPLKDQAKVLYAQKLSNNVQHCPDMQAALLQNASIPGLSVKEMGLALKMKKKKIFFSVKQKEFMTDLFNQGEKSGSKIDPYTAAEHMRSGAYMFKKDEFLTAQQISGFFSRLAQQQRKTDKNDYKSAKSEIVRSQLKTEILETIED